MCWRSSRAPRATLSNREKRFALSFVLRGFGHTSCFPTKHRLLSRRAPAITMSDSAALDRAMAGNQISDSVLCHSRSDRAARAVVAQPLCQVSSLGKHRQCCLAEISVRFDRELLALVVEEFVEDVALARDVAKFGDGVADLFKG